MNLNFITVLIIYYYKEITNKITVTKKGKQNCDLTKLPDDVPLNDKGKELINMDINNNYYFYLAFENSLCDEYITEKFFRTLNYNTVPVVMGGPR